MDDRNRKALMRAGVHMALALSEVLKAVQVILTELARADAEPTPEEDRVQRIPVD